MPKENENIHLYIIEQEYKRNKAEQNANDSSSKEAQTLTLTEQINPAAIRKLEKMHPKLTVIEAHKPVQPTEGPGEVISPQIEGSTNAPDVSDLLASFQKMRTEEQMLLETREDLLARERDLQSKLVKEIAKKKIAIDELKSEIQNLDGRCREMAQALGIVV